MDFTQVVLSCFLLFMVCFCFVIVQGIKDDLRLERHLIRRKIQIPDAPKKSNPKEFAINADVFIG